MDIGDLKFIEKDGQPSKNGFYLTFYKQRHNEVPVLGFVSYSSCKSFPWFKIDPESEDYSQALDVIAYYDFNFHMDEPEMKSIREQIISEVGPLWPQKV